MKTYFETSIHSAWWMDTISGKGANSFSVMKELKQVPGIQGYKG